jgi:WD40 repeat protein
MAMRSPTTRPIVVSASDDATVRVWDLDARGLLYQPLEAHKGKVDAVAVGELRGRPIAVSGGNDRTVRVWDLNAGRPLGAPLVGHDRRVLAVAVGELGGRPIAVSGGNDNTVRVWDLDAGELMYEPLVGHDGNVLAVAVGELGGRPIAVSASEDFTVRVWDLAAGGPLGRPLEGHDNIVNAVAVGELDGRPIAVSGGCDKLLWVWDLQAGGPLGGPLVGHDDWVNAVAVGQLHGRPIAVSGGNDQLVWVWDLAAGGQLGEPLVGHEGWVNAVAVGQLHGRPIAVSGGTDDTLRVWDLAASGPLGEPLVHNRFVNAVAVGELHDRSLAASGDAEETVRPAMATTLPAPGREAQTTLGSRRVDQGGSARSRGRSDKASGRRGRRAAPARGSGAVTTKPRWWQVVSLGQGVVLSILLLAGIVGVGVGVKGLVDSRRFMATASSANGVVVDVARVIERRQEGSGSHTYYKNVPVYYPVVQFVTAREQVVRFEADEGSQKRSAYQVGASIRVLYDPANPQDARLDTWASRWGFSILAVSMGLLFIVIVAVIYWVALRSSGRAARRMASRNPRPQETERRADG